MSTWILRKSPQNGCVSSGESACSVRTVLAELWRDEVLPENVATRVRVPKAVRVDDRKRIILSDAEFTAFIACPDLDHEPRTKALLSRTFGGMRTNDLHARDWSRHGHVARRARVAPQDEEQ
jgi:hypothetical protein